MNSIPGDPPSTMEELELLELSLAGGAAPSPGSSVLALALPGSHPTTDCIVGSPRTRDVVVGSPAPSSSRSGGGKMKKPCNGCKRIANLDHCFLNLLETVRWQADDKGGWCTDCFTVHRTVYGRQMSLVVFANWIKDPANLEQFVINLAVYLSYK